MDVDPLDLVLAASLACATIFLGALPTGLLRENVFARLVAFSGGAWFIVALTAPASIIHYYIFLGLLGLYAWRQLRHDHALSGKGWLTIAAGLGISLGVVLILAVTPMADRGNLSTAGRLIFLVPIYLAGAVVGLALVLYFFTRPAATRAGLPAATVRKYANLLCVLVVLRAALFAFSSLGTGTMSPPPATAIEQMAGPMFSAWAKAAMMIATLLVVPVFAWLARRLCLSPAPSRSGPALLVVVALGMGAEILFLLFSSFL